MRSDSAMEDLNGSLIDSGIDFRDLLEPLARPEVINLIRDCSLAEEVNLEAFDLKEKIKFATELDRYGSSLEMIIDKTALTHMCDRFDFLETAYIHMKKLESLFGNVSGAGRMLTINQNPSP